MLLTRYNRNRRGQANGEEVTVVNCGWCVVTGVLSTQAVGDFHVVSYLELEKNSLPSN